MEVNIIRVDPWTVRESVAEAYSQDDLSAFLLGDAAHRRPPAFGLGSNTCIQDAYNLAWKIAYTSKGYAGPSLLASYHEERQPVGAALVHQANEGLRAQGELWKALGIDIETGQSRPEELEKLYQEGLEGAIHRGKVHKNLDEIGIGTRSLGMAYNQWYTSRAIYLEDELTLGQSCKGTPLSMSNLARIRAADCLMLG